MSLCKSCEKKIEGQAKFCTYCGAKQDLENKLPSQLIDEHSSNIDSAPKFDPTIKIALIVFVLLMVIVLYFLPTNTLKNNSSAKSSNTSSIKSSLQKGIEYKWYADNSCSNDNTTTCLSFEEYKALCIASEGLTKNASEILGMFQPGYRDLIEGGDVSNIGTYWSQNYKYQCRATITASGIYRGTSKRITAEGGVTTFILNNENKLLVHHASETNF